MQIPRTTSDCGSFSFILTRKLEGVFNDVRRERPCVYLIVRCAVRHETIFHSGISVAICVVDVGRVAVPAISEASRCCSSCAPVTQKASSAYRPNPKSKAPNAPDNSCNGAVCSAFFLFVPRFDECVLVIILDYAKTFQQIVVIFVADVAGKPSIIVIAAVSRRDDIMDKRTIGRGLPNRLIQRKRRQEKRGEDGSVKRSNTENLGRFLDF